MEANIPLVDLAGSQEEEPPSNLNLNGPIKRKAPMNQTLYTVLDAKRACSDDSSNAKSPVVNVSTEDFQKLEKRISDLESVVTHNENSSLKKESLPTRAEFDDLSKRVSGIEGRLVALERTMKRIKVAFLGNDTAIERNQEVNTGARDAASVITQAEQTPRQVAHRITMPQQSTSSKGQDSSKRVVPGKKPSPNASSTPVTVPKKTAVGAASQPPVVKPSHNQAIPSGRISQVPNKTTGGVIISPVPVMSSGTSITPRRISTGTTTSTGVQRIPPSGSDTHSRVSNVRLSAPTQASSSKAAREQPFNSSSALTANISQILNETQTESLNSTFDEIPAHIVPRIPIKQEFIDKSYPQFLPENNNLRKVMNRFLVYIYGEARKVRNQDSYIAGVGWSLSESRKFTKIYRSEMVTKLVKNQAEILAALIAVESLKMNAQETGPLMITIVTRCQKLVAVMSNVRSVYPYQDRCTCPMFPCGHVERWDTVDTFAMQYYDDLPRLVLSMRCVDVIMRSYLPEEQQVEEDLKKELQKFVRV